MIEMAIAYYAAVAAGFTVIGGGITFLIIDDLLLINKTNGGK